MAECEAGRADAASGARKDKVLHFNYMGQPKPLCLMYVAEETGYNAHKGDGHLDRSMRGSGRVQSDKLSFNLYPLSWGCSGTGS